jgi:ketosteroid isomerase-like protein
MTSNDVEANKAVVLTYLDNIHADPDTAIATFADDATLTVPGSLPISGTFTKDQHHQMVKAITSAGFAEIPHFEVASIIAEGDRVAVEATVAAPAAVGGEYTQRYHFAFEVRDGKISSVREYCDTDLMRRMMEQGMPLVDSAGDET